MFAKDRVKLYQKVPSDIYKKSPRINTSYSQSRNRESHNDLDPVKLWGNDDLSPMDLPPRDTNANAKV